MEMLEFREEWLEASQQSLQVLLDEMDLVDDAEEM
jgi:hypothetical protein